MSSHAAHRSISGSLGLIAQEVTDLAAIGDQLQALIARLVATAADTDPAAVIEAQAADLLSQRLAGLAAFLRALAATSPTDIAADIDNAVRVLTLAEQARRLSNPASSVAPDLGDPLTFWD